METMSYPHAVALIWMLGNVGKQAFVDQSLARMGIKPHELRADVNLHGNLVCAFAGLSWALLHPWYKPADAAAR